MRFNKTWLGVLAAVLFAVPSVALAADTEMDTQPQAGMQAGKMVRGKISQVLRSDHELLLSDRASPLVVDTKAKISRDGKDVAFSDLKPGDDIRASFDANGAKIVSILATSTDQNKMNDPNKMNDQNKPSDQPHSY